MRFDGKVVLVTGGALGIGRAACEIFAERGASVAIVDWDEAAGKELLSQIEAAGYPAMFHKVNVADFAAVQAAADATVEAFGTIDSLVVSAGIQRYGTAVSTDEAQWDEVMGVNLKGAWNAAKACIPYVQKQGGSIVNFSSTMGIVGSPSTAAYVASKGGVRLFTKSAALHCAKEGYGIRVNSVHPGWIRTPMSAAALDKLAESGAGNKAVELTPMGRVGEPDDVAYGVLYLACDESRFVTGTELVIDGGYTAQ